ncbi:MAG TPA: hypothetical protein PKZ19_04420 [Zoogloea sp.]|nr:hypothetical protein [Zoogloea sp.]
MTDQKPSTKVNPRFFDGVWIGKITEVGFIVFDPTIHNLYDDDDAIALWVEKCSSWRYFDEDDAKAKLRENLGRIADSDRSRVARNYWRWRCEGRGYSKEGYLRLKQEEADEKLIEQFFERQQFTEQPADEELSPEEYYLRAVRERTGPIPEMTQEERMGGLANIDGSPYSN